jgi:hypothetical protein
VANIGWKGAFHVTEEKQTLGSAIDQIVQALESLDEPVRATALTAACLHLKIALPGAAPVHPSHKPAQTPGEQPGASAHIAASARGHTDIRTLKEEKKPKTAKEMACLVAYYFQELAPEGERKTTVVAADMEKYFKQAQFKLPQRIAQLLPDTKSAGYLDSVGRGEYRLNPVGYNLVAHTLPHKRTEE